MGQFQGWADDEESDYYQEGPPYSTCDMTDLYDEDEHTTIEVEKIKEVKKKPETKKK